MGMTKRVAELVVKVVAAETRLPYVSVRFGNVLRPQEVPQRSGVEAAAAALCPSFNAKSRRAARSPSPTLR